MGSMDVARTAGIMQAEAAQKRKSAATAARTRGLEYGDINNARYGGDLLLKGLEIRSASFASEIAVLVERDGHGHNMLRVIAKVAVRHLREAADGDPGSAHHDGGQGDLRGNQCVE